MFKNQRRKGIFS